MNRRNLIGVMIIALIMSSISPQLVVAATTSSPSIVQFTRDFKLGIKGNDVKELQKYLNSTGFTVSKTGAGSKGKETTYLGPKTLAALVNYQKTKVEQTLEENKLPKTPKTIVAETREYINNEIKTKALAQQIVTMGGGGASIASIVNPVISSSTIVISSTTTPSDNTNSSSSTSTISDIAGNNSSSGNSNTSNSIVYVINFDGNGSTNGSMAPQSATAKATVSLVSNSFSRTGYIFTGWATSTTGNVVYSDQASLELEQSNITLYAQWLVNSPKSLSYNVTNEFVVNTPIDVIIPSVSGVVDSYSIEPALPNGLILNQQNGQIGGMPTVSTERISYTITARNSGGSVSFPITIMVYGTIDLGGLTWLDRNLGADRVAIAPTDYKAYGSLFQWGRKADGHQLINWFKSGPATWSGDIIAAPINGTTTLRSDNPNHGNFITVSSDPANLDNYDWRVNQDHTLWNPGSANNPCPMGWHVPSKVQWEAITGIDKPINNAANAFSLLKLTVAGSRHNYGMAPSGLSGISASYWTSTGTFLVHSLDGNYESPMTMSYTFGYWVWGESVGSIISGSSRSTGHSVRCVQD